MKSSLILEKPELEAIGMILNETDLEEGDTLHISKNDITLVNKSGTIIITAHHRTLVREGQHSWEIVKS